MRLGELVGGDGRQVLHEPLQVSHLLTQLFGGHAGYEVLPRRKGGGQTGVHVTVLKKKMLASGKGTERVSTEFNLNLIVRKFIERVVSITVILHINFK